MLALLVHRIGGRELERGFPEGSEQAMDTCRQRSVRQELRHRPRADLRRRRVRGRDEVHGVSEWSLSSPALRNSSYDVCWKARKTKFLLDRAGHPPVTAVLIIWGPGAPTIPTGFQVDDRGTAWCVADRRRRSGAPTSRGSSPRSTRRRCPRWSTSFATTPTQHRASQLSDVGRPLTDELLAVSTRGSTQCQKNGGQARCRVTVACATTRSSAPASMATTRHTTWSSTSRTTYGLGAHRTDARAAR